MIKNSGRAADDILDDPYWPGSNDPQSPNYIRRLAIPEDTHSLVALLRKNQKPTADSALIERLAPLIHENYCHRTRKKALKNNAELALLRWEELSKSIQQSTRSQAAFAVENLREEGYEVRPLASGESCTPPTFAVEEVERMAEREHGRFNAERIMDGWHYQPGDKDTVKKTRPYLIPWSELDPAIAEFDRDAVREYPMVLRTADMGVFKR